MKILVTGGAGFIGCNFIKYLIKTHKDAEIICFDKLTYAGNLHNIEEEINEGKLRFIKGDIADEESVNAAFRELKPDLVVNFAAETHVDRSISDPSVFIKTNVMGTQVLLDASVRFGVKRFHQVSTDEVYGDLPIDGKDLFSTEESPLRPSSPYSASKAAADLLTLAYHRTYGLNVTITRCSNNYGPYQFPEKLIPLMITNAEKGLPLPVYGDGKNVRDWLYVEDHCAAIDEVLFYGKNGEIYNVSGNEEKSNVEIVDLIIKELGKGQILYVPDRPGHDKRYALSSNKITKHLNWKPQTPFNSGITETIRWYRSRFN